MSILRIRKYPDPILREKCQPVKKVTEKIKKLIEDMIETLHKHQGIGLAGPQVGKAIRVIVIDIGNRPLALINPKILEKKGEDIQEEGCLSLPGIYLKIKRAKSITVEALNKQGKKIKIETSHLASRALQHEIDHLDGILIIDRIPFWKKIKLRKKLKTRC